MEARPLWKHRLLTRRWLSVFTYRVNLIEGTNWNWKHSKKGKKVNLRSVAFFFLSSNLKLDPHRLFSNQNNCPFSLCLNASFLSPTFVFPTTVFPTKNVRLSAPQTEILGFTETQLRRQRSVEGFSELQLRFHLCVHCLPGRF